MSSIMKIDKGDVDTFEKCRNYTVSIIECDQIGVPHACLFTEAGFKVIGVNTNPHMFKLLRKGGLRFSGDVRPRPVLERHMKEGRFTTSPDARKAASKSDIVVIAVQIAIDEKRARADYSLLEKTCKEVGMGLRRGALVLFVSATGPGIVEGAMREVLEKTSGLKAGRDFGLACSPFDANSHEGLGKISSCLRVVGAVDELSLGISSLILGRIAKSEIVKVSNVKTAEAISLFQEANRETSQALTNELALLCESLKIDFLEVLNVVNMDNSRRLPSPGIVDSSFRRGFYLLLEEAENVDSNLRLMVLSRKINEEIVSYTFRLVKDAVKACGKTVRRARVSILGISARPNVKEPPGALTGGVVRFLQRKVRTVQIYDPFFSKKELAELGFEADKLSKVVEGTDCIVVLVGHSKFRRLNLKKIKFLARESPAIVDMCQVVDPSKAENYGFVYRGLGRGVWSR